MKSQSLLMRTARVALLSGLAIGANAANFDPRTVDFGAPAVLAPGKFNPIAVWNGIAADLPAEGNSAYSILAGLGIMVTIVLKRKSGGRSNISG